jgi:HEAT repeat protein
MLEGLDRINWDRLAHAYGRAGDVPGHIRALASPDARARQRAVNSLVNTIFHQGSRYRASAPAVPFLFELLKHPEAQDKEQIIVLLERLAVGYPENYLLRGFDPVREFAKADRLARRVDLAQLRKAEPDEADDWDPGRQALWARDAYQAVLGRAGTLQRLTRATDLKVRMAAVRVLAWFPEAAARSIQFVRKVAHGLPEADELANAIHCLAILGRYLRDCFDVPWLGAQLQTDRPFVVRVTAAFALAILRGKALPAEALEVLLDALQDRARAEAAGTGAAWHWLGLLSQVGEVIHVVRPKATEPVLTALCRAAERVDDAMAGADTFYALLAVAFPNSKRNLGRDPDTGLPKLDTATLTDVQLRALRAIGNSPVWRKTPFFCGRLMDIGLDYGLPWEPDQYQAFLAEAERHGGAGSGSSIA